MKSKTGFWLSDPSAPVAEIVAKLGFDFVVLDAEHGIFDLRDLESFTLLVKGLGLQVWTKVLGPTQEAVQQALDFGADGVIIPHTQDRNHTARITSYAKFPPTGERSLSGGRPFQYAAPKPETLDRLNKSALCFPLIEHPLAVRDVEDIAGLPTVDGCQIGPGDLALMSGRGVYSQSEEDWADTNRCVRAFRAAEKPWMFPAWTEKEQRWALDQSAPFIIIGIQYIFLHGALAQAKETYDVLAIGPRSDGLSRAALSNLR
ncbi:HpcH/HpaI aldolase family protein [Mesorhizobium sp. 2RAF21]|uniref:HpcH/HpaI aldolase family protein n=1 Tax=Mesorhizobium sp. 2RAF21 TaxID=3232995 RepID=UPI003F950BAD